MGVYVCMYLCVCVGVCGLGSSETLADGLRGYVCVCTCMHVCTHVCVPVCVCVIVTGASWRGS